METTATGDAKTISTSELCTLTGYVPAFFTAHRHDLPQPSTVQGKPGRPANRYDLNELADFALTRTAHLSEAECRLILALSGRTNPSLELVP